MKKIVIIILAASLWLAGCNFTRSSHNQSITIKKNDFKYQFTAEFPPRKSNKVFNYIKQSLKEDKLFSNPDNYKDTEVNLGDSVRFHLTSEPGHVKISFRKMDNPEHTYTKLEQMCVGLKEVLR